MDGRIKTHRKMLDRGWFSDSYVFHVFSYCLLKANHVDIVWKGIEIKRGSFVTSTDSISKCTGITGQSVRTAMMKLKSTNEITSKSTNKYTIITVVKWEEYQLLCEKSTNKSTSKLTNDQQTTNKQLTTDNKYNNINKEIIKEKSDILSLLGEEEINKYSGELSIAWIMIESGYDVIKKKKDIIDLIEWINDLGSDYLPRKEDGCLNWNIGKVYAKQRLEYFKTLAIKKRNHKNSIRTSFSLYSKPKGK